MVMDGPPASTSRHHPPFAEGGTFWRPLDTPRPCLLGSTGGPPITQEALGGEPAAGTNAAEYGKHMHSRSKQCRERPPTTSCRFLKGVRLPRRSLLRRVCGRHQTKECCLSPGERLLMDVAVVRAPLVHVLCLLFCSFAFLSAFTTMLHVYCDEPYVSCCVWAIRKRALDHAILHPMGMGVLLDQPPGALRPGRWEEA